MKKTLIAVILIIFMATSISYGDGNLEDNVKSVLVGDFETGDIIYEHNTDKPLQIASLTKLMTYLVVMDDIKAGNISLEDMVTIGEEPTKVGGSSFNLKLGEKVKLKTLIEGMLIPSGNDASVAIAEHVAGSEGEFTNIMNQKAKEIGLNTANFINASGMPVKDNGQNSMSVKDLFKLSRHILKEHPEILNITNKEELNIPERNFRKASTNPLLDLIPKVDGLKTGYTGDAGNCLISTMEISDNNNDKPFRVIAIQMGAKTKEQRKETSKELLEYAMKNFKNKVMVSKDDITKVTVDKGENPDLNIYPKKDFIKLVKKTDEIKVEKIVDEEITAPIKKGDKLGEMVVYKNGKVLEKIDLIAERAVEKRNIFERIFDFIAAMVVGLKNAIFGLFD
ncbi:D-alanyl-D-alanine carboxypeptidase family protein [Dethiothermospora halolimnae]|uniref:D-alanyl-D-alanine carboxypeptidase family protein n=1 Tax=Dethiothermospora halolimnae TaxID=3114390 RepID=UPI003CCBF54B